jgi:hypothetical protein
MLFRPLRLLRGPRAALCDPPPFPVRNYTATIRIARIVDGNRSFVEWWATFDCAAEFMARRQFLLDPDGNNLEAVCAG